jgi:cell wall-associated NlpC family hydrolase
MTSSFTTTTTTATTTATTTRTTRDPRRVTAICVAVVMAFLVSPLLAPATVEAGATIKSSSPAVASHAAAALDALQDWTSTGSPVAYVDFLRRRDAAAGEVASELGLEAADLRSAWAAVASEKQIAVLAALSQLGVPYRSMASIEGVGFDCSGLLFYAYARAGIALERSSRSLVNAARRVSRDEAVAGDHVYYPGHISMYLGVADAIVHSPNSGNHVRITFVNQRRVNSVVFADPLG